MSGGVKTAFALWLLVAGCGGTRAPISPTPVIPAPGGQTGTLRDAARSSGKLVGTAVQSGLLGEGRYAETVARHFDYLTAEYEMKWDPIERTRGNPDFRGGDAIVSFGLGAGMQIKGHALVWHESVPAWAAGLPPADFRAAFTEHIRSVAEHYRGRVRAWDVVNEAIADDGSGLRDTVFRQKLGDDYVAEAFRLAKAADPQALLFYNDYGAEGLNRKSDRVYELVQGLKSRGVPIDGVGLQMHIRAASPPDAGAVAANMRRLASLGLSVNISEMDVRIQDVPGALPARLDVQKSVYRSLVGVCVAEPRCDGVTFWGFTDAHTWIDGRYGPDDPLLFDDNYAAKPAFDGVFEALGGK